MTSGSKEHWSTGLRVFEMIRVWLDRITEAYCKNPYVHDPIKFWEAHPGWFNPDAVRSNMIGSKFLARFISVFNTRRFTLYCVFVNPLKGCCAY